MGVVRWRGGESEEQFDRRRKVRWQRIESAGDSEDEEGIEAVREKLMFEFKTAANKMKDKILRGEKEEVEEEDDEPASIAAAFAAAAVTDMTEAVEEEDAEAVAAEEGGSSPVRGASGSGLEKKDGLKEMCKFSLTLGHRPPHRPKKWPRAVQKQLDVMLEKLKFEKEEGRGRERVGAETRTKVKQQPLTAEPSTTTPSKVPEWREREVVQP